MNSPGSVLGGRYQLDERVGTGGMGEVWRSTDQVLDRVVAVKIMHPALLEEAGFSQRFRSEARAMATIDHPGVIAVYDYQSQETGAFLVMAYVDGEPLSRLLRRDGSLPPVRVMELAGQAAEALAAAHERGIVHRDVKPANLLLRRSGSLVLTDFGIARTQAGTQLTATGAVLGTPSYLTPEQVLGQPATALSDVYALGIVAYEALTGEPPFARENTFASAMARVQEPPPELPAEVPPAVAEVVRRALATDPAHRWPSASEFAIACRRALAGAATAAPAGPPTAAPAGPPTAALATGPVSRAGPVTASVPMPGALPPPPPTVQAPPNSSGSVHSAPTMLARGPAGGRAAARLWPSLTWTAAGVVAIASALIRGVLVAGPSAETPGIWYQYLTMAVVLAAGALLVVTRRPAWAGLLAGLLAWEWFFLADSSVAYWRTVFHWQHWDWAYAGQVSASLAGLASALIAALGLLRHSRALAGRPRPYLPILAVAGLLAVVTATSAVRGIGELGHLLDALPPEAILFPLVMTAMLGCAVIQPVMILADPASLATRLLVAGWLLGGAQVVLVGQGPYYSWQDSLYGMFWGLLVVSAATALAASLLTRPPRATSAEQLVEKEF